MKTRNVIIVLLIGIVAGYLVRMLVHTHEDGKDVDDKQELTTTSPPQISTTAADSLIQNYKGKRIPKLIKNRSQYIVISDSLIESLAEIKRVDNRGVGFLLFFAADKKNSKEYNYVVVGRDTISENAIGNDSLSFESTATSWFKIPIGDTKKVRICPPMCDVIEPPLEDIPTPSDTTNADNGKKEEPTE